MSAETWVRIIFVLIAIGMAGFLVANLATGRTRVGGRNVDRRTEPRLFWGAVGKTAILMTCLALTPLLPPERDALPLAFLGLFGGQLFEMLVTGIAQMPAVAYERATQPRPYWGWLAFHAAVVVLLVVYLAVQPSRVIIL